MYTLMSTPGSMTSRNIKSSWEDARVRDAPADCCKGQRFSHPVCTRITWSGWEPRWLSRTLVSDLAGLGGPMNVHSHHPGRCCSYGNCPLRPLPLDTVGAVGCAPFLSGASKKVQILCEITQFFKKNLLESFKHQIKHICRWNLT